MKVSNDIQEENKQNINLGFRDKNSMKSPVCFFSFTFEKHSKTTSKLSHFHRKDLWFVQHINNITTTLVGCIEDLNLMYRHVINNKNVVHLLSDQPEVSLGVRLGLRS